MKIDSLKDLKALITLCQKQGVESITVDGISLVLGSIPQQKESKTRKAQSEFTKDLNGLPISLSEEELLFYSSGAPIEGETLS